MSHAANETTDRALKLRQVLNEFKQSDRPNKAIADRQLKEFGLKLGTRFQNPHPRHKTW
ncbi:MULTISPECIES: hypothetical protein [Pirellulaceae]|uniref:hypothetical protein n=1 Tax=Pirellulaceae TaxID=2691357 RepID=UPI001304D23F|nr:MULTISPECIES: hypothetical protein [Pirellulaceae]